MISNRNSSTPDPGKMDTTEQPVLFWPADRVVSSGQAWNARLLLFVCLSIHTHTTQHSSLTPMNVKIKRGDYNRFFLAVVSNGVECIIGPCLLGLSAADWWREKREKKGSSSYSIWAENRRIADAQTTNITGRFSSAENINGVEHSIDSPPTLVVGLKQHDPVSFPFFSHFGNFPRGI
jgi:hypothetical protein